MKNKLILKTFLASVFMLVVMSVSAQHKVTGKVMEGDEELIGVTVVEQGNESNGTITDFDGTYEINVSSPTSTLIFSYVGMETQNVPIDTRASINVEMGAAAQYFDEIVVVGYGNQKRSNISGSVATISSEDISETPVLRVEQALQGRTSGVQISQNSGSPGARLQVRIRGAGTVNDSDPLYIVDGIPVENMDFLNPNDIESVSVLKDAASAAIYGARAANGVVLITTKSGGKDGVSKISYESYYGIQQASSKIDLLNAREYAVINNELHINAGEAPFVNLEDPSIFNEGTDWQEAIFETAPIQSHQVSINGGSDGFNVGLSANYFKQDGIIGGSKSAFDRKTIRTVFGYQAKKWLNVGANIGFTNLSRSALTENNQFDGPVGGALNMDPLTTVFKPDGTYAYSDFLDTDIRNPVNNIQNTHGNWTTNRVVGAVFGTVDFTEKLKLKSTYSVDVNFAQQRGFRPTWDLAVDSTDAPPSPEVNLTNSVFVNDYIYRNWQWENVMTYTGNFGDNHKYTALGGVAVKYNHNTGNGSSNTDLVSNDPNDAYIDNTEGPAGSRGSNEWVNENALLSYFGRVDYDFRDKYLAMVAFRADGSSKFGKNKRFGYFPAVSLGWVISREDFFNISAVSLLKLRASWGQNGNDRIGDYRWATVVLGGQNYTFGSDEIITNGSVALRVANPELQWETVTQTNFGLDLELFDGKINFIADYFIKKTADMLYEAPIPAVVGALAPERNIGDVENRGVELALQYRNRDNAFKYELGGNVSFINNEVLFLGGGDPTFSGNIFQGAVSKTDVGQPIASFFGHVTDGIFQNQAEVEAHAFQTDGTAPGDIRFKDLNGDGVVDEDDKTYIGNPTPNLIFGINGNMEFKNIDLSFFLQGVSGNDIYNASFRYDKFNGNKPASTLNRWTGEGTSDFEPRVSKSDLNFNSRISDRFVEDGSYFRIKNVQIGYNLPSTLLDRMKLGKFRIYGSVQNLWTFTNYSGYDPEIGATQELDGQPISLDLGIDRGFYPQSRTILGGIQIIF